MKFSKRRAMESAGKTKLPKQNVVEDPRFSRLHTDPRFQRSVKRKLKVSIDSRFTHIFSDRRFSDPLALDKRGRKLRKPSQKRSRKSHPLQQYYHINDSEDDDHEEKYKEGNLSRHLLFEELQKDDIHQSAKSITKDPSSRSINKFTDGKNGSPVELSNSNQMNDAVSVIPSSEVSLERVPEVQLAAALDSEEERDADDDSEESLLTESMSSSSSKDSTEEEDTADSLSEEAEEEKIPIAEKETQRLAVVNMDWDHIRAVDILAVMTSFLPKGGQIVSVSVFPSEFGLQQVREEEKRGPQGLFHSESSDEDEENTDEGFVMGKLRQYEKDKLRYYYAVVECNSRECANFLYQSCDGMEFERTSNTLDLRFVPEDMKFSIDPRDVATEVPLDYQAPRFETRALQHSRVKLTWDDDEPDRVKTLHQKFDADQLNDMDFKVYLASDESDREVSDELEENLITHPEDSKGDLDNALNNKDANGRKDSREKYRALLLGSEEVYHGKDKSKNDQDMEITFHSGLEELSKRLMDKNKQKDGEETVWESYLRKRKEKRKLQKQQSKDASEHVDDSADEGNPCINRSMSDDDAGFGDPFFNSVEEMEHNAMAESESEREMMPNISLGNRKNGAQAQKKKSREEEERSRADLELLFADELASGSVVKGYNLKKKRKGKRNDKQDSDDKIPTADHDDPRFSAVLTSHSFAIDPTEPEFARSAAHLRVLLEKQRKCLPQVREIADFKKPESSKTEDTGTTVTRKDKQELSMMVRSLKRKVGAAEMR